VGRSWSGRRLPVFAQSGVAVDEAAGCALTADTLVHGLADGLSNRGIRVLDTMSRDHPKIDRQTIRTHAR
jgi:hypothetical protein